RLQLSETVPLVGACVRYFARAATKPGSTGMVWFGPPRQIPLASKEPSPLAVGAARGVNEPSKYFPIQYSQSDSSGGSWNDGSTARDGSPLTILNSRSANSALLFTESAFRMRTSSVVTGPPLASRSR